MVDSLFKACLFISFLGILILLVLSNIAEPKLIEIKDINTNKLDNFVRVQGNILKFEDMDNIKILELQDKTGIIDVVLFEEDILKIKKGMQAEIIGKVSEYQGKMQINAEKIRAISS